MTPRITTHQRRAILGHHPTDSDTVSNFCKDHGISRDSYYRIKNDTNPLLPQTTAPQQPHTTYPELTWVLVRQFRISLAEAGYDDGPRSIKWSLVHNDYPANLIPSTSRIAQYLHDNQLTRLNPKKRPHTSYKRFQKEFANELWQLDGFGYTLPDGHTVTIFQIVDDATRFMPQLALAPAGETLDITLTTLMDAINECGAPREILSDNARAFTLQRYGMINAVDAAMAKLGILVTPGPFYRPQNQGKIERSHQPVLKRLDAVRPETRAAVGTVLKDFKDHYNYHRQHQGLGEAITPAAAYQAATKAKPRTEPIDVWSAYGIRTVGPLKLRALLKERSGIMTAARRRFSQEFKDELCQEVISTSKPIKSVAEAYGVGAETLRNWMRKYRDAHGSTEEELTVSERARLKELERENHELRAETAFLKKASAYFAREQR